MDSLLYLADLTKYIIAGTSVLCIAWILFARSCFRQYLQVRILELKKENQQQSLSLQLQAYERFILFIERIRPEEMILRELKGGMPASSFAELLMAVVRQEYQHNITQQLYVSRQAWQIVQKTKEDTLTLLRECSAHVGDGVSGLELSKSILSRLSVHSSSPYDDALDMLKSEAGFRQV